MQTRPEIRREFALYVGVSAVALALDTSVMTFALQLGASLPFAASLGFGLGLVLVYAFSTHRIFRRHTLQNRRLEFLVFACIGVLGLLVTQLLLWLLTVRLGQSPVPAKLATAGAVFFVNFSLRKLLLFTSGRRHDPKDAHE